MTEIDEARNTATLYLWMRGLLTQAEEHRYRDELARIVGKTRQAAGGLDTALREAAEKICQMRDCE